MSLSKTLLLATAFATIVSLPAYATEATAPLDAPLQDAAPAVTENPVPLQMPADAAPAPEAAPETSAPAPVALDPAPVPVPDPVPAPAPETAAAPEPAPAPAMEAPVMEQPPVAEPATPVMAEPAPVEEAAAPVVEEPVKKKVAKPVKLSALAKKYGLIDLDTDGNKSLSRSEFTANGFANDKVFNRFDSDANGKLTNAEINAYASVIEANSKK